MLDRSVPTLVLATDVDAETLSEQVALWEGRYGNLPRFASFESLTSGSHRADVVFALLIQRLAPSLTLLVNSSLGFRAMSRYGSFMTNFTSLTSVFFSQSPHAMGRPHAVRYLETASLHGRIVTDNKAFLDAQGSRLNGKALSLARVLRVPTPVISATALESSLAARSAAFGKSDIRFLWFGRWEPHKDTDLIVRLARERPDIVVEAFGFPLMSSPQRTSPAISFHTLRLAMLRKFMSTGTTPSSSRPSTKACLMWSLRWRDGLFR